MAGPFSAASNGSFYITSGGDLELTFGNYGGGLVVGGRSAYWAGTNWGSWGACNYSGTVTQDGGTVNCLGTVVGSEGYEYIGCYGYETSYYNQSGGINTAGHVILGGTPGTGYYNLNGGTLSAGTVSEPGNGGINFGGGTLRFATTNFTCDAFVALADSTTSTIDTNGYAGTISGALGGTGALTVTGGGTLVLSSYINSNTGMTTVNGGSALAYGANNVVPGAVTVNGGAVCPRCLQRHRHWGHAPRRHHQQLEPAR